MIRGGSADTSMKRESSEGKGIALRVNVTMIGGIVHHATIDQYPALRIAACASAATCRVLTL